MTGQASRLNRLGELKCRNRLKLFLRNTIKGSLMSEVIPYGDGILYREVTCFS